MALNPEPQTFFVLRCLDCDEESGIELDLPFPTPEARGRWATKHTAGTDHERWNVFDVERTAP